MTFQGDPHRTLGVAPGASLNEIKSAYRRLVKQYHPDAAGERALPRFLAIQAAYERLVDSEGRLRPTAPPARGAGPRPSEAWRADPSKARASRDAWRARRAGSGGTAGASGAGTRGSAAGASSTGAGGTERPPRQPHARRGPRKATPGSTTYDEAAELPLDPEWDGGAWYGPSSGTYWTINPREYADPRKHGPEYLARARRAAEAARGGTGEPAADGDAAGLDDTAYPGRAAPGPDDVPGPSPATDAADDRTRWRWTGPDATTTGGGAEWGTRAWRYDDTDAWPEAGDRRRTDDRARARSSPQVDEPLPDLESIARRFAPRNLLALARRPDRRWRLLLAFAGWPPIGFAVGTLVAELTGCAALSPSCPEPARVLPLVLQPLVIGGLFLVPPAAAVAAFAAIVALAVALPVAAVLSVGSMPESRAGAPVLGVITAVAYFVGLVAGANAAWRAPDDGGETFPGA